jgi:hypothetical protein
MDKTLYLLREDVRQVDFKTKVKYLYDTGLNSKIVTLIEANKDPYMYLSSKYGVLYPDDIIEPYKVILHDFNTKRIWDICSGELIARKARELEINHICFLMFGEYFKGMEKLLEKLGYKVSSPLKYFRTMELRIKWVEENIINNICNKLL